MANQKIVDYIKQNINSYPISTIKLNLLEEGYRTVDINEAIEEATGTKKNDGSIISRHKKLSIAIFLILFIAIVGASIFLFYNEEPDYCNIGDESCSDERVKIVDNIKKNDEVIPDYDKSPFGIFASFAVNEYSYFYRSIGLDTAEAYDLSEEHMNDLGAHWTRSNVQFIWTMIEPDIGDEYNWENAMMTDSMIKRIYDSKTEMHWLGVFADGTGGAMGKNPSRNPLDYPEEYANFVQSAVERYDGDGINDSSPNVKVKYWQAGNEVMGWTRAGKTSDDYVEWLKIINKATKKSDINAKIVLIAPTDGKNVDPFIKEVIEKTQGQDLFDVIDIHHWKASNDWKISSATEYRKILDDNGYEHVEIWSCEYGTWQGGPVHGSPIVNTEQEQAQFLIKGYVYNIKNGVSRIMWNNLIEWNMFMGQNDSMFNSMGLISDGQGPGEDSDMLNKQRLAYYSYKLMTEKLEGSDFENIETIIEKDNTYLYKFTNKATKKQVYVGWYDSFTSSKTVTFNIKASKVLITESVPYSTSGKDITSYDEAFNKNTMKINGGSMALELNYIPVYIEEYLGTEEYSSDHIVIDIVQDSTCGDGICDKMEMQKGLCPTDCQENIQKPANNSTKPSLTETDKCINDCVATGKTPQQCLSQCENIQKPIINNTNQNPTGTNKCINDCVATGKTPQQCLPQCMCGDGVCDEIERANNVCPVDC